MLYTTAATCAIRTGHVVFSAGDSPRFFLDPGAAWACAQTLVGGYVCECLVNTRQIAEDPPLTAEEIGFHRLAGQVEQTHELGADEAWVR